MSELAQVFIGALVDAFAVREPKQALSRDVAIKARRKFFGLGLCFSVICVLVIVKLTTLQLFTPDKLLQLGRNQRVRSVELLGLRGTVTDRNGTDLAISVPLRTVVADPKLILDKKAAAALVADILGDVDQQQLLDRLNRPNSRYEYVARQIEPEVAKDLLRRLQRAGIAGFFAEEEQLRVQTATGVGTAILGSVSRDGTGIAGIEKMLNERLRGKSGQRILERAQDGSTIANSERVVSSASPGDDVQLTLDRDMQFDVERALISGVKAADASSGVAIVGDPQTGELLAIANVVRDAESGEFKVSGYNMAFAMALEPGSVIKMVTASGVYNEGLMVPSDTINVPHSLKVADHTYTDHDNHPVVPWRIDDILAHSSNIGTILLSKQLGSEKLESYLRKFGFGSRSPIDFPRESAGILRGSNKWAATDAASIAIGQGIATTPIQLWSAYNTIANDGRYVDPKIIKAISRNGEAPRATPASPQTQVVSPQTAKWIRRGLGQVVTRGTASGLEIPGYSLAGKTGTAYKPNPKTGTYQWPDGRKYTAVFAGFLPAANPEVSIAVVVDEPTNAHTGASAAAPIFQDIATIAIRRMGIAQDQPILQMDSNSKVVRATPAEPGDAITGLTDAPDEVASESGATSATASESDAGQSSAAASAQLTTTERSSSAAELPSQAETAVSETAVSETASGEGVADRSQVGQSTDAVASFDQAEIVAWRNRLLGVGGDVAG